VARRRESPARRAIRLAAFQLAAKRIVDDLHDGQRRVYDAIFGSLAARFVAMLCPRRWGKSRAALMLGVIKCITKSRSNVVFTSLLRSSAKEIAVPLLDELKEQYGLKWTFNKIELIYVFENGSRLRIAGADHKHFARLFRGPKYDLVIIDEAGEFLYVDLEHLAKRIFGPALGDRRGALVLGGTPGEIEVGFFWEVVIAKQHPEWTTIIGHPHENHYNLEETLEMEEICKQADPDVESRPWFQREYRGRWVVDDRMLMVALVPAINYLYAWEPHPDDEYVLAIDWGYEEPSAYVLGVWNREKDNKVVYLDAWEEKRMSLSNHRAAIDRYRKPSGVLGFLAGKRLRIIADPGGQAKAIVQELRSAYKIPVEAARKDGKEFFVSQVQSDVGIGQIQIYNIHDPPNPQHHGLAKQWSTLAWRIDPKTKSRKEGRPRNVHDAALYLRRACYPEAYAPRVEDLRTDSEKTYDIKRRKALRLMRKRRG
jgi:hypothetical protein